MPLFWSGLPLMAPPPCTRAKRSAPMKATAATPRYSPAALSEDGSPVVRGTPQPATILTMPALGPPLLVFTDAPIPAPWPGVSPPDPARATYIPPAGSHAIPRGAARPLATRVIPPPPAAAGGVGVAICAVADVVMESIASGARTRGRYLDGITISPGERTVPRSSTSRAISAPLAGYRANQTIPACHVPPPLTGPRWCLTSRRGTGRRRGRSRGWRR